MLEPGSELVDVNTLRVGMFVELDVGWLSHPFPTGSFKITTVRQIDTIRGLGIDQVRYVPAKSDPLTAEETALATAAPVARGGTIEGLDERARRAQLIADQHDSLQACERRFAVVQETYRNVRDDVLDRPESAREQCDRMVSELLGEMDCDGESAIRLLSEGVGERSAMHPVNVMIMCMLLGKAMGISRSELSDLGTAAFLHDMGKLQLPSRVRSFEEGFSIEDFRHYQEHVARGVAIAKRMQLSDTAITAIAQHHEMIDGSGFPARPPTEEISQIARILALVNRYDNLCNPARLATALTPHEALSLLFAQHKARFDNIVLSAFIRMMGVYPPGSVVQLIDGRYAIVVSVNSSRPLKPKVIVHEPSVSRHEALILDMETEPTIGIRRSLKPASLPADAFEYLGPRQRVAYYFENSGPAALTES